MNNTYYILRHGNSLANKEGIILSNLELGVKEYGLTEKGRDDIYKSVQNLINSGSITKEVVIISSPFKRTKESALIASELFNVRDITYTEDLKERFFGEFDLKSKSNYKLIWDLDSHNPEHQEFGVESVNHVLSRAMAVVNRCEKMYMDKIVILVTHGDTAQILECGFKNMNPRFHRSLKTVEQAEYRLLNI